MKICLFNENTGAINQELLLGFEGHTLFQETTLEGGLHYDVDFLAVLIGEEDSGLTLLKKIKNDNALFLKPLLVLGKKFPEESRFLSDEQIQLPARAGDIATSLEKLAKIAGKFKEFKSDLDTLNEDQEKDVVFLRYLATRDDVPFFPQRNIQSKVGYTYPSLALLHNTPMGGELDRLETFEEMELIRGTILDRIHLCPECETYNINFREVCPDCHSLKIKREGTLHHFRCAYVGKEKDFANEHRLICPKCNRELKHIGVDYDRPSENFWCETCSVNFSDPSVNCYCLSCSNNFSPEDAKVRSIKEYKITKSGFRAAKEGFLSDGTWTGLFRKELNLYRYDVFEEILKLEIQRSQRYKSKSCLVHFIFNQVEVPEKESKPVDYKSLRLDIVRIFQDTFRTTDIATDISPTDNLVILTHTDQVSANRAMERLNERLLETFQGQVNLQFAAQELSAFEGDHYLLLNELNNRLQEMPDPAGRT